MTIQIRKVAVLEGDKLAVARNIPSVAVSDLAAILANIVFDGQPIIKFTLAIGTGPAMRLVTIDVPFRHEWMDSDEVHKLLDWRPPGSSCDLFVVSRGQIFAVTGSFGSQRDFEVVQLMVRKHILEESTQIASLRRTVENLERAGDYAGSVSREVIASDVKMAVWARDGGKCVVCQSTERLQFDHVIPAAKGGSGSVENIQILCQPCNLRKSDRIL